MAAKKNYQSITIYKDMEPLFLELTDEEAGKVIKAIFQFSCHGEDTDFLDQDRLVRSAWGAIKMKLEAGEAHRKEISETNTANVKKRWEREKTTKTDTTVYDSINRNTQEYDRTTYTDTDTVTGTNTPTISSTVTKTEQEQVCADADSVDRLSVSAAADAEPPTGDLFSVAKLNEIVAKNKIKLSDDGVKIFHEEMQESGWTLYGRPVEKKFISRALNEWTKKHVEFHDERLILRKEVKKNKDAQEQYFKKHYGSSGYKTMLELDESIWETIKKYVSETRFEEEDGAVSNSTIIKYCPKEAFDEAQIKFLAEEQGIEEYELRSQNRVEVDEYLEDE